MSIKNYGLSIGDIIKSNKTGDYEVISFEKGSKVRLRSITCGNEIVIRTFNASRGQVGNKMYPTFFGKGYLGDGIYKTRHSTTSPKTPQYTKWENMLARCYYPITSRYSAYGGRGVEVCDEWLNFQNFAKWFDDNYIDGWHLDKDILGDGMLYSPDVCRFVPQEINNVLVDSHENSSLKYSLPLGVSYDKRKGIFQCTLNVDRCDGYRFYSKDLHEVMAYYRTTKTEIVRSIVENYKDVISKDVYEKLSNYVFEYTEGDLQCKSLV